MGGYDYSAGLRREKMRTSSIFGDLVRTGVGNMLVRN
jgi:hypothetical protein